MLVDRIQRIGWQKRRYRRGVVAYGNPTGSSLRPTGCNTAKTPAVGIQARGRQGSPRPRCLPKPMQSRWRARASQYRGILANLTRHGLLIHKLAFLLCASGLTRHSHAWDYLAGSRCVFSRWVIDLLREAFAAPVAGPGTAGTLFPARTAVRPRWAIHAPDTSLYIAGAAGAFRE